MSEITRHNRPTLHSTLELDNIAMISNFTLLGTASVLPETWAATNLCCIPARAIGKNQNWRRKINEASANPYTNWSY